MAPPAAAALDLIEKAIHLAHPPARARPLLTIDARAHTCQLRCLDSCRQMDHDSTPTKMRRLHRVRYDNAMTLAP